MYNYRENMKADIRKAIAEYYDLDEYRGRRDDLEEELNEELWVDDSVTGNGSGSYTFNSFKAKEYVLDNMDLLAEMVREFDLDDKTVAEHFLTEDWEYFDVSIRCFLLPQMTHDVLEEMEVSGEFENVENDSWHRKSEITLDY